MGPAVDVEGQRIPAVRIEVRRVQNPTVNAATVGFGRDADFFESTDPLAGTPFGIHVPQHGLP